MAKFATRVMYENSEEKEHKLSEERDVYFDRILFLCIRNADKIIKERSLDIPILLTSGTISDSKIDEAHRKAVEAFGYAAFFSVIEEELVPKDTGELEASATIEQTGENSFYISWHTDYARRRYFETDVNISNLYNKNATYLWYDGYLAEDGESQKILKAMYLEVFYTVLLE